MPGGLHPPLSVIESWPSPSHHSSNATRHGVVAMACVLMVLSLLVVAARLRARSLRKNYDWDDYLLLASMIPTIGLVATICLGLEEYGFGEHIWELKIPIMLDTRKVVFAAELLYLWSSSLIKLSILSFHTRLAKDTLTPRFVLAVRMSIVFIVLYMITFTIVLFFTCQPFSSFWNQIVQYMLPSAEKEFSCPSEGVSLLINTGISIFLDFITTILPFFLFYDMVLPRRQKMALGGIFALGFTICIVGIVRFWYIYKAFFVSYDVTFVAEPLFAWTVAEVLLGTMCASAPALKIFFRSILHSSSNIASNESANKAQSPANSPIPRAPTPTRSHSRSRSLFRRSRTHDSFYRLEDDEHDADFLQKIATMPTLHIQGGIPDLELGREMLSFDEKRKDEIEEKDLERMWIEFEKVEVAVRADNIGYAVSTPMCPPPSVPLPPTPAAALLPMRRESDALGWVTSPRRESDDWVRIKR